SLDRRGVFARVSALQFTDRRARNAKPAHFQDRRGNFVVDQFRDCSYTAHGNVVDTSIIIAEAVHDPRALMSELAQNCGEDSSQPRVKDADQLPRWARWIQQRSKRVKNGAHIFPREALTHFRQLAKRWMILAGKKESDAVSLQGFAQLFGQK